jgi:hypothetical protein
VLDVGAVNVKLESPKVFVVGLQENVGVAFPTLIVMVVVPPDTKFVVSVGVNVAVITELP